MTWDDKYLVLFFRYLWLLLAIAAIVFIINKNVINTQQIIYQIDLSRAMTTEIEGPYPQTRVLYDGQLNVLAEPLYLQAYLPGNFTDLTVTGDLVLGEQILDLGLKQMDGTWQWKKIASENFSVNFYLADVYLQRKKMQLIFSLPNLNNQDEVKIKNLKLILNNDNF
jgi:hypothetical protein